MDLPGARGTQKIVQLNDIVKVTVSVKSPMTSQGTIDRKKRATAI